MAAELLADVVVPEVHFALAFVKRETIQFVFRIVPMQILVEATTLISIHPPVLHGITHSLVRALVVFRAALALPRLLRHGTLSLLVEKRTKPIFYFKIIIMSIFFGKVYNSSMNETVIKNLPLSRWWVSIGSWLWLEFGQLKDGRGEYTVDISGLWVLKREQKVLGHSELEDFSFLDVLIKKKIIDLEVAPKKAVLTFEEGYVLEVTKNEDMFFSILDNASKESVEF